MAEVVIANPSWWLEHPEELVDALQMAALLPEHDEPTEARNDEIVLTDPGWWADHMDELRDGLARVDAERERSPDDVRERIDDEQAWIDLDTLRQQRMEDPSPQVPPPDRDRGLER